MVKKFETKCDFGGQSLPVTLYLGDPAIGSHPLNFQSKWLSKEKGGSIPANIMSSFGKLVEIAQKNRVSFEELCAYVIEELKSNEELPNQAKQASALSSDKKDTKSD